MRVPRGVGRRRGQAMVEFALVATMLAMLTPPVLDFALWFYYSAMVSGAATEGARAAARGMSDKLVCEAVQGSVPSGTLQDCGLVVILNEWGITQWCEERVAGGDPAWTAVDVGYWYVPLTPYFQRLTGGSGLFIHSRVYQRMRVDCSE